MSRRKPREWLRLLHKWAGLTALLWLFVLGATGVLLDHPDWRLLNQVTVPESWGSPDLTRFIRVTHMRQILVDPADQSRWIGGSERGLWASDDGGSSWRRVSFAGLGYSPQLRALAEHPKDGFAAALAATDDGIWRFAAGDRVERFALAGTHVNSLAAGDRPGVLVGVAGRSRVFTLDAATGSVAWRDTPPIAPVIAGEVPFSRYILNTHFGHGVAPGRAGILINDIGGIAMIVLGTTGFLYWFTRRRWRRTPSASSPAAKRRISRWLYRSHGPIVGILGIVPILYLSVTGIFADHIRAIYAWADSVSVPGVLVPAGFSMRSLDGEVQDIVANPTDPGHYIIATRKGLYHSRDAGRSWTLDPDMPIRKADYGNSLNLFRVDDTLFLGAGVNASFYSIDYGASWSPVTGPVTGLSSAARSEGRWFVKNSQGVFTGELGEDLEMAAVKPPPLTGMPLFLYLADIHTGHAIAPWFPWVNDVVSLLAIALVVSGPIIWWRRKWM